MPRIGPGLIAGGPPTTTRSRTVVLCSAIRRRRGTGRHGRGVRSGSRHRGHRTRPGSSSTDFWGVAHVPSQVEREVLSPAALERRLDLMRASWAYFDDVAARVSPELRPGLSRRWAQSRRDHPPRIGGEPEQFSRKVEVRRRSISSSPLMASRRTGWHISRRSAPTTPQGSRRVRGRSSSSSVATAHHVMDHAWEMEDRDPS